MWHLCLKKYVEMLDHTDPLSPSKRVTMAYDRENRLRNHLSGASVATYLYDAGELKRVELVDGARTTLLWDGSDYLQARG